MQLQYFKNLDGMRAIAALAVIVAHSCTSDNPVLFRLFQLGNQGVSLFFVISGFVITRILLNNVNQQGYFYNFYVRRTLRIFPLYYFALLCYDFLPYLIEEGTKTTSGMWYHFVYLQNFARTFNWQFVGPGHFWSLAVEEHFYLMWPFLVYFAFKKFSNSLRALTIISIGLIVFSFLLRYIMLLQNFEINVFTFTRLDQLSMGCLIAILEVKGKLKAEFRGFSYGMIGIGLLGVLVCMRSGFFINELFKHDAFGLIFAGIITLVVMDNKSKLLDIILGNSAIQYLGKISYGLYVWHVMVIGYFHKYIDKNVGVINFFLILGITVVVSSISYFVLEKPFLELKERFKYSKA
jgi:peptidoglycan/LPS O-acetylase OafA/YrhL